MEPPSAQLQKRLKDLGLCQPADLRRCRKRVKRLARDLPAFDSVWIDALLQNRVLTPFQAKQLESTHPQRLQVQSWLLIEPLGTANGSQTYLARKQNGKEVVVLKQIDIPQGEIETVQQQLQESINRSSKINSQFVISPHEVFENMGELVTVSHRVQGIHLQELLVRRGRLPAEVVLSLCRQLVAGLDQLECSQLIHGEVQLTNIRLTSFGQTVLVDTGLKQAISPRLTIRADVSPEEYDGIAPELIGTGNVATVASDMYAVGCLLWHLLAGRPPFPTGDPLAKLASHQTKRIALVSQWAPETSSELDQLIHHLTSPLPAERPASWGDVAEMIGQPRHRDKKILTHFASQFSSQVNKTPLTFSHKKRSFMQSRWGMAVLLLFVCTGAVLTLMDEGARAKTLSILSRPFSADSTTAIKHPPEDVGGKKTALRNSVTPLHAKRSTLLPLPKPNAAGIIELTKVGPYAATDISVVGLLHLRGAKGIQPQIVIDNRPCQISAEQLILENVHFKYVASVHNNSRPNLPALLLVQSQDIALFGCSFRTQLSSKDNQTVQQPVSVAWRSLAPNDNGSRRIILERNIFANGTALFMQSAPKSLSAKNCLKTGEGSFLTLGIPPKKGTVTQYLLSNVTLRNVTTLLETQFPVKDNSVEKQIIGQTIIEANQSVFELNKTNGSLFRFSSRLFNKQWLDQFELTGEGTLAGNQLSVAKWYEPTSQNIQELNSDNMALEGLVGGAFEFAGNNITHTADNVVKKWQAPLRSASPPGIDASRLPQ